MPGLGTQDPEYPSSNGGEHVSEHPTGTSAPVRLRGRVALKKQTHEHLCPLCYQHTTLSKSSAFLIIKNMTLLFPVPQQPLQQSTEEGHRRAKGKGPLPLICSLPPPTSQPPLRFLPQRQQATVSLGAFVSGGSFSV